MTRQKIAERIIAMQETLYRLSTMLLRQECDREDAVQSCIEKAWRKQRQLRQEEALRGWVIRILINECHTILRQKARLTPMETLPEQEAPPDADPNLYAFFTGLPEKQRVPMVLFYVEGDSVEEIASTLKISPGAVKARLHRGREKMKQLRATEEVPTL